MLLLDENREDADALAFARALPHPLLLRQLQPRREVLPTRVPLDDDIGVPLARKPEAVLDRIVPAVETHEQEKRRELLCTRHDPLGEIDELLLAVLAPGAKLAGEAPAFLAEIGS